MERTTTALNYFNGGFNCTQSVLMAYKDKTTISEESLLKISCGFGAGMGRMQQTCGAVSGAVLVLGIHYGQYKADDDEAKETTYTMVRRFNAEFMNANDTTECEDLLGCDLLTESGNASYQERKLRDVVCCKCVTDAVDILEKMLV